MSEYTLSNGWQGTPTELYNLCSCTFPDKPVKKSTFKRRLEWGHTDLQTLLQPPIPPTISGSRGGRSNRTYPPSSPVKQYTLSDGTIETVSSLWKRLQKTYPGLKVSRDLLKHRLQNNIFDINLLKRPDCGWTHKRKAKKVSVPYEPIKQNKLTVISKARQTLPEMQTYVPPAIGYRRTET